MRPDDPDADDLDDLPGADRRLRLQLLGSVRVTQGDEELDLRGPRARLLLAILAVAADRPVPYGRLVDDLYGVDPPATARKSIQVHVSNLRRALGDGVIATVADGYQFVTDRIASRRCCFGATSSTNAAIRCRPPSMR